MVPNQFVMVKVNNWGVECFLVSVTCTVKLTGVAVAFVGLPAMTPLAFSVKPAGNLFPFASDHLYGATPPVACNVTGP